MQDKTPIPNACPNFLDFYSQGPYAPYLIETRAAGRSPVKMFKACQPAGDFSDPAHPDITLCLPLCVRDPVVRDLGTGEARVRYRPGDMEIVPPNTSTKVYCEGMNDILIWILPFDAIKKAIEYRVRDFSGDFGQLHDAPFRNAFVEQLCWRLWLESEHDNPYGNLYAEGLLLSIIATLLGHPTSHAASRSNNTKLTPATIKKLNLCIDRTPDHELTIQDLAMLANMPQHEFIQAFANTTGAHLDHYVSDRRVTKARELLSTGRHALHEIHHVCGFSSAKHMTRIFSERLGLTPLQYWRELRS